jgi:uncharacterized membrane protein YidH (DUF202 family)
MSDERARTGRQDTPTTRWLRVIAAVGYGSRGLIYGIVGALALLAAWGVSEPKGLHGALAELLDAPLGNLMLALLGLGMVVYAAWRFLQGVVDIDQKGHADLFSIFMRMGYVVSFVTHLGLAVYALVLAAGIAREGDASLYDWTRPLMSHEGGRWVVGFIGLVVICMAIAQVTIAWNEWYKTHFVSAWRNQTWARTVARVGLGTKAIAFALFGGFFVWSALTEDPEKARGLGGALQAVRATAYGRPLLTLMAAGLLAYALYSLIIARYRNASWP